MSLLHNMMNSLSPTLVAAAGGALVAGLPWAQAAAATAPLALLQAANLLAFGLNVAAVSVPGRIDGTQDQSMRQGDLNPTSSTTTTDATPKNETSFLQPPTTRHYEETYSPARGRTLVSPSGWAFAIWGPIYIGEALLVAAQFAPQSGLAVMLPAITAPFVAANLFQSLWCVAFRPSFRDWATYVSPVMLAGTAYSLSQIALAGSAASSLWLLPLTVHFGWTTAATLVNLSGSIAMDEQASQTTVTAVGHASAVLATAVGVGVTLSYALPAYGLTLAWALTACSDGMRQRQEAENSSVRTAARVQQMLCGAGAVACTVAAGTVLFL
jgi:hypothetical protein